jgi:hypothetical protein
VSAKLPPPHLNPALHATGTRISIPGISLHVERCFKWRINVNTIQANINPMDTEMWGDPELDRKTSIKTCADRKGLVARNPRV